MNQNVAAFIATIIHAEGTDLYPNPYAATFGCNVSRIFISDFSAHPHALGWLGYPHKGIMETAAGALQINYPTWLDICSAIHLRDFTKESQDTAAVWLIQYRAKALDLINGGNVQEAISACSKIWASLPGSLSGQPQKNMANLIQFYTTNGGAFA